MLQDWLNYLLRVDFNPAFHAADALAIVTDAGENCAGGFLEFNGKIQKSVCLQLYSVLNIIQSESTEWHHLMSCSQMRRRVLLLQAKFK